MIASTLLQRRLLLLLAHPSDISTTVTATTMAVIAADATCLLPPLPTILTTTTQVQCSLLKVPLADVPGPSSLAKIVIEKDAVLVPAELFQVNSCEYLQSLLLSVKVARPSMSFCAGRNWAPASQHCLAVVLRLKLSKIGTSAYAKSGLMVVPCLAAAR